MLRFLVITSLFICSSPTWGTPNPNKVRLSDLRPESPTERIERTAHAFTVQRASQAFGSIETLWLDMKCKDIATGSVYPSSAVIDWSDGKFLRVVDQAGWRMHACKVLLAESCRAESPNQVPTSMRWIGIGQEAPRIFFYTKHSETNPHQAELCVSESIWEAHLEGHTWSKGQNLFTHY